MSKQGFTYVLDRRTGAPVVADRRAPVPQSTVPGERIVADAAISDQAARLRAAGVTENDLIDFTPELEGRGARGVQAVRDRADLHAAVGEGHDRQSRMGRRRELGRRLVRSGDEHAATCRR